MAEMNNTVTDVIGGEYQKWKPNDKIFISSPTGTGKTYFILNVLLPYAYQKEKQILYLVNRRILKQQLERELSRELFEVRYHIKIELYQTIEKGMSDIRYNGYRSVLLEYKDYDYVICDECHYFLADSNYNTNTGLSFRCIQDIFSFSNKIRIFLSATICDVKDYIISDDEKRLFQKTFYYGFHWKNTIGVNGANKGKEWNYEIPCNYDYLDIHIINKEDEISDLVMNGNGKWLIFVDSINLGKELQEALRNKWKHSDDEADKKVIMLSSDYYDKILKNFDCDGEDAFLKEQLRWLGKSEKEIGDIIARSKISREEKSRQAVLEKFEEIQNTEMDKEEAVVFKKEVRADLLVLVQGIDESNTEKEKVTESLKKNDRPISKENMEFLRKYCNLPYEMVVEKASGSSGKKESTYVVRGVLE